LIAVRVVGVGIGVNRRVGVGGVVADDLHRARDDGAAAARGQADLLALPGLGERPLAEGNPAVAVVLSLVDGHGVGAAGVVHGVLGAGGGTRDDRVLGVDGVVAVGRDVQVPGEAIGRGA